MKHLTEWLFSVLFLFGFVAQAQDNSHDFLLMEPDAEVIFITTGGNKLRADWTEAATKNLQNAFRSEITSRNYSVVDFDLNKTQSEEIEQLLLLYEVVSASTHLQLPHKGKVPKGVVAPRMANNIDLTIGKNAKLLKDIYGTDKALFINHSAAISSGGVFLSSILIGAATGYVPIIPTVHATSGHVIDLETGNILKLGIQYSGDAREYDGALGIATNVVKQLRLN